MKTVNFTEMKNGTKDEYLLLDEYEQDYIKGTADRILKFMRGLTQTLEGYKITRLEHSLQTATRAYNDKADEEMVVAALLHDIGDELAPLNHSEYAAAVLKPYVSKKTHWIVQKHNSGKGAKSTRGYKWKIIYKKRFYDKRLAMSFEYKLKKDQKKRKYLLSIS